MKAGEQLSFDKSKRLLNSRQYSNVLRRGRTYRYPLFVMVALINSGLTPRVGITVSKKVSKRAVERNRIKRLIRESFRRYQYTLPNYDMVIIAQPAAAKAENRSINSAIENMWENLNKQLKI